MDYLAVEQSTYICATIGEKRNKTTETMGDQKEQLEGMILHWETVLSNYTGSDRCYKMRINRVISDLKAAVSGIISLT